MVGNSKPVSNNSLGQFKDEVVGGVKSVAKDTAKGVLNEPKKILESILGKPSTDTKDGEQGIEDPNTGATDPQLQQAKTAQQQQLMMKKKIEDQEKAQKLLALHRQRLQEEEQYHEMKKKQKEQEEEVEKQKEEQEETEEIVQLQKDQQKSEQLQRQTKGRLGSKEVKGSKF